MRVVEYPHHSQLTTNVFFINDIYPFLLTPLSREREATLFSDLVDYSNKVFVENMIVILD